MIPKDDIDPKNWFDVALRLRHKAIFDITYPQLHKGDIVRTIVNKSSFAKAFFCASKAPPIDDKFIKDAIKRFSPKRFENQMKKILEI